MSKNKDRDELLRSQINDVIRGEIQEGINDYIDSPDSKGFADEKLKVKIPQTEVDNILREYKKIKRKEKSNLSQVKKLGLVDKHGKPL
tara:strand:+ start:269 stop:532 length:264 start_codon:yes stop_codon:yes gene_type:complete